MSKNRERDGVHRERERERENTNNANEISKKNK